MQAEIALIALYNSIMDLSSDETTSLSTYTSEIFTDIFSLSKQNECSLDDINYIDTIEESCLAVLLSTLDDSSS